MFDREPLEFEVTKFAEFTFPNGQILTFREGATALCPIPDVYNGATVNRKYFPHGSWMLARGRFAYATFGEPGSNATYSIADLESLYDFIVKHYVSEMKSSAQVAPNGTAGHFCEGCGTFCAWVESNRPGGKYACPDCRNGGALARLICGNLPNPEGVISSNR